MSPEQIREHAERIIRSQVEDIEYGSIGEMLEAEIDGLPDEEADKVVRAVDDAIGHAEVTVRWLNATP